MFPCLFYLIELSFVSGAILRFNEYGPLPCSSLQVTPHAMNDDIVNEMKIRKVLLVQNFILIFLNFLSVIII